MSGSSLSDRDQRVIWHPFTPQLPRVNTLPLVRGEGALLFDETGRSYIDAMASWWVNLHGHTHPYIVDRVTCQLQTLEHAVFSGFTHQPAVELAEKLIRRLPYLSKVFYSDDGSTAVEVALKMAIQYWRNKNQSRTRFIALENAYHGDTFGSMSAGARNAFNKAFEGLLFEVIHIPVPLIDQEEQSEQALREALQDDCIAGFIVEPLVQGAGGMVMYSAEVLERLFQLCRNAGIPIIADEVMTGFGRTGTWFATDQCATKPDIVCLSKGLTGGFLPLGATLCTEEIHAAFLTADRAKTFFHGHSYTANPTACAAALASMDLMEREETWQHIAMITTFHQRQIQCLYTHRALRDARSCGTIAAFELNTREVSHYLNTAGETVHNFFLKQGIILRPLGNIIYILPPYCITHEQLTQVYAALEDFLIKQTKR
jgi:adenosylmethionine-8-amino-7-oxononanoate aminotransferase